MQIQYSKYKRVSILYIAPRDDTRTQKKVGAEEHTGIVGAKALVKLILVPTAYGKSYKISDFWQS